MHGLMLVCVVSGVLGQPQDVVGQAAPTAGTPQGRAIQDADDQDAIRLEDIIVRGRRGAAEVRPEFELGAEEIDNLGAYDIREVLARLSERLGLTQPPIVIVNGRRAVDSRNFLGFPPDALVRVEALPPQAGALSGALYGDPARRVVNIVLQPEFRSRDAQAKTSRPTAGGTTSLSADARQSDIHETDTRQFGLQISRSTALYADERPDYLWDNPGRDGMTLRPATDTVSANVAATGTLGDWSTSLSANASAQDSRFTSTVAGEPVETRQSADSLNLNAGLGGKALGWSVRLGLDGLIAQGQQSGLSDSRSRNLSMLATLSADRTLIELPTGPISATIYSQYSRSSSDNDIDGVTMDQSSQALDMTGNLAVPLSRSDPDQTGASWGDLSLTLGGRLRTLDDTDAQGSGLNTGLAWSPVRRFNLSAQWSRSTDGPTRQQRFDPILNGPPRTIYDFATGQSVEILPLLGGNPDLRAQTSESLTLTTSVGPFGPWNVQGNLNYQALRSIDAIGGLPTLTPIVEAAFPDRFIRDAEGRLITVDQRAINLQEIRTQSLSSGLTLNIPFEIGAPASVRKGSLQVALSHSWQIDNVIIIRDGIPTLDLLAGDGGGIPRHQLNLRLDGRYEKWGLNASANWRGRSRIRRDIGQNGPDDLRLDALVTVGFRLSYVFDAPVPTDPSATPSRRNDVVRMELEVENLFDARPDATLGDGRPAPGYGRDDQDPLGRVVRMTVSKRF